MSFRARNCSELGGSLVKGGRGGGEKRKKGGRKKIFIPAQRQPLFKIAGSSLLSPPTQVTARNPPLLKRLPFKSRFQAELQLCVKPGSHLMCDGEWALGSRKQLSLLVPDYHVNKPREGTPAPMAGHVSLLSHIGGCSCFPCPR